VASSAPTFLLDARSTAREVTDGWRRYSKGRHPAALNMADCYTYGLVRSLDAVLLCVGNDLMQTDIELLPL
jgi:ribonuclease VapC